MDIDTFLRRCSDVLLHQFGDVIVEDDTVQRPAFVGTCHFLYAQLERTGSNYKIYTENE